MVRSKKNGFNNFHEIHLLSIVYIHINVKINIWVKKLNKENQYFCKNLTVFYGLLLRNVKSQVKKIPGPKFVLGEIIE